jgi:gliding motility-associated lipoprotein GldH
MNHISHCRIAVCVQLLLLGVVSVFTSCHSTIIQSQDVPYSEWQQDSVLTFSADIQDTINAYDILFLLRTNNRYPYQNLWLFVAEYQDSMLVVNDTIECTLADERGRWLGRGTSHFELPLLYETQRHFRHSGNYTFVLTQGMREESLLGVENITLKLVKSEQ